MADVHAPVRSLLALLCMCICLAGGCSTYDSRYSFTPGLADVSRVPDDAQPAQVVRTLVSVAGVRWGRSGGDADEQQPASVEVRFRIENDSDARAEIPPDSLRLVPASLQPFDEPIIAEGGTVAPPNDSTTFIVFFPFPGETDASDYDLSGLNVRWSLVVNGNATPQSVSFSRQRRIYRYHRSYHYPYGYYHYGYRHWHWHCFY